MAFFTWSDEYSVGVGTMDRHHQKLFQIINKLHDAMKAGTAKDMVSGILKELLEYTRYHFGEEEKMLESINYSGLPEQKAAHKIFIQKIEEYQKEADMGMGAFLGADIARTVSDWLVKHIAQVDKKYSEAMKAKGIR